MKLDFSVNELKDRVTLEKAVVTQDSELNRVVTYQAMKNVWAKVTPVNAGNAFSDARMDARVTYTVVIRKQALESEIKAILLRGCRYYPTKPWITTDRWMIGEFTVEVPNG